MNAARPNRATALAVAALAQLPGSGIAPPPAPAAPARKGPPLAFLNSLVAGVIALVGGKPAERPVVFREVRFKVGFECLCGRKVDLHQDHEQHACGCGTVYRFDGVASGAVAWLRAKRGQ